MPPATMVCEPWFEDTSAGLLLELPPCTTISPEAEIDWSFSAISTEGAFVAMTEILPVAVALTVSPYTVLSAM